MTFIVNGKIYDTDRARKVFNFRQRFPIKLIPQIKVWHYMELYRTNKGNWFSVKHESFGRMICIPETESSVKDTFRSCNNAKLYVEYFNEFEEA